MTDGAQNLAPFDAAVVIPTTLRPELLRALRSVYAQDLDGRVQIAIGVDVAKGSHEVLAEARRECPERMHLTVIDPGYSTSQRNGGLYPVWAGGALRTLLSYAAHSRYVAYLDDDNWWAPRHLSSLLGCIGERPWAYSYRWYVDPGTQQPMCIDRWESLGPGRGMYAQQFNGFVDTNTLLIDKLKCHWQLPAWSMAGNRKGAGPDRVMFARLAALDPGVCSGEATAYYVARTADVPRIRAWMREQASAQAGAGPSRAGGEPAAPPDAEPSPPGGAR